MAKGLKHDRWFARRLAAWLVVVVGLGAWPVTGIADIGSGEEGLVVAERVDASDVEARPLGLPAGTSRAGTASKAADGSGGSMLSDGLIRTAGSLTLVLGLIFGAARLAKRFLGGGGLASGFATGGRAPAGVMEVLGRYPIGRGQSLVLLRLDSRVLLLGQSGSGSLRIRGGASSIRTLCEITEPEDVASLLLRTRDEEQETLAAGFGRLLKRFDAEHTEDRGDEPEETFGRSIQRGGGGDRAELLDERAVAPMFTEIEQLPRVGRGARLTGELRRLRGGGAG